ncbi:hypothetical protein JCM10213_004696 [Rhodosporidiobolus nylandii]
MQAVDEAAPPCPPALTRLLPPTPPVSPPPLSTSATPPTSLASLPTEILSQILSLLPLPSLASLALVSRSNPPLLPLARKALYRTLPLRNQAHGRAAPSGSSALDSRSTALLRTLEAHPALATLAARIDFDLLSHLSFSEISALLGRVFAMCPSLTALKLGAGAHGHGIGFKPLRDALALPPSSSVARGLRSLNVENCAGAPHTLAAVLVQLEALEELRVGQFLLEKGDFDLFRLPKCRLRVVVAERGRITPIAFDFLTHSSAASLRQASLPVCEKTALDLSPFSSLTSLTLFVSLSSPQPGLSPAHPSFERTMSRLSRNFTSTVTSVPFLSSLTLKGSWDAPPSTSPFLAAGSTVPASALGAGLVGGLQAGQPIDLVLHARLLHSLPSSSLAALSIRTELNALALCAWMDDEAWWKGKEDFRLLLYQKLSFSRERREFQQRVRERVDLAAGARGGVKVEWMQYEQW